ncbi:hypothetical protein [Mycobacterium goodii]|uniref:AbiJ-related protein n=1 Tax=Mycolicibacterium goodii TaxID=134601 RepID=UPI00194F9191
MGAPTKLITPVTRRRIFDTITCRRCAGREGLEPEFLARIYDLDPMPSTDARYKSAVGDSRQHRVNNPEDWTPPDPEGTLRTPGVAIVPVAMRSPRVMPGCCSCRSSSMTQSPPRSRK